MPLRTPSTSSIHQSYTHCTEETGADTEAFVPVVPDTLGQTGLNALLMEDLIFKLLLSLGVLSGKQIANHLCIPYNVINPLLGELKNRLFVAHRTAAELGDFYYMLTEQGQDKALTANQFSAYVGAAPVLFEDYAASVYAQSIRRETPNVEDLKQAFSDLVLPPEMFDTLGPAVNSGRGLFLYGEPGNGKTSIAERISRCFKDDIYLPKTLLVDGQLVKLYDPQCHEAVKPPTELLMPQYDQRWVKIKRPVVIVGGELTMESLEIKFNNLVRVSEAPLQLKANGGVFLIDDFGRQRIHHADLLNRWIVPLEKHIDYLTLPNGKKVEAPFEELIIFSTNINPKDLVDDAFLRRIPYKVHVEDPSEAMFRSLFQFLCPKYSIAFDEPMIDYLIEKHYRGKRPFRACQVRDILEQIVNASTYRVETPKLTESLLDAACKNYFTAMGAD